MRTATVLGIALLLSMASNADADDKQVCSDAYTQGQALRDQHKLMAAREQLRSCARDACSAFMKGVLVKQCAGWLEDVEKRLPSVVPGARLGQNEVLNVQVSIDGALVTNRLDGRAIELDPGEHTATFVAADGTKVDLVFTADEGTKAKAVVGELPAAPAPRPPPPEPVAPTSAATPDAPTEGSGPAPSSGRAPRDAALSSETAPQPTPNAARTIGYVGLGVGLAGVATAAAFGFMALTQKSNANCDSMNECDAGPLHDARTAATIANVALGVGGGLAAFGLGLVLLSPSGGAHRSARLALTATTGKDGAGMALGGTWP